MWPRYFPCLNFVPTIMEKILEILYQISPCQCCQCCNTWSKQNRVNYKLQEITLSGRRGGGGGWGGGGGGGGGVKYSLPACNSRHSRKMYDIRLFQLLLSMIVV